MSDLAVQARELLASEYERAGRPGIAACIIAAKSLTNEKDNIAIRAIERALQSSPSGAMREAVEGLFAGGFVEAGLRGGPGEWKQEFEVRTNALRAVLASPPVDGEGLSDDQIEAIVDRCGREGDMAWTVREQLRKELRALFKAERDQPSEQDAELIEKLRSSAKAFREHPIYTQDGDGAYLTVQAAEMEEAAARLAALAAQPSEAVRDSRGIFTSGWKAGHKAALEEAARVADERAEQLRQQSRDHAARGMEKTAADLDNKADLATNIATDIRTLKTSPAPDEGAGR